MKGQLHAYLRLTRPPNLLTAVSDIWAGVALSGYMATEDYAIQPIILLSVASIFLYGGGVVMNDVFDADLDAVERPERPIPAGIIAKKNAALFGLLLLAIGIVPAALVGVQCGILAFLIAIACIIYDRWGKHHPVFGPLNMGICRGLNLLLGMSILAFGLSGLIAIVPVLYIAAVTLISRGEVHGGKKSALILAFVLYILVVLSVLFVARTKERFLVVLLTLLPFALMVFPPLWKALKTSAARQVGKAVKAGVLGLILLNAAWVATGAGIPEILVTLLLLPLSLLIARYFEVT